VSIERRTELPTWCVVVAVYAGWILLTLNANAIPLWALIPLGGYLIAWHGSLQHEVIHGHPTRVGWINTAIAMPPIALWLPYEIYRVSHLEHHGVEELTHPATDPESRYVDPRRWAEMGAVRRALYWIERPLIGRLLFGPISATLRFWGDELRRLARGDFSYAKTWFVHIVLVAGVTFYLVEVCELSMWRYIVGFAYPGLSLTLLRSFTEHRPATNQIECSAIVESGPVCSLLFLNNNLHLVHHADPSMPWFEIPAAFQARREELIERSGDFHFTGYLEILLRYGIVPLGTPKHTPRAALLASPGRTGQG
jgi:fatty acid desaturase